MATGVQVWSKTPATNATADSNVNFAEGQAPSSLNDSCRAAMASVASWRDDNAGALVTAGTSTAFTVATNQVESALTAGFTVTVQFSAAVDPTATLAVDGLTAKPINLYAGTAPSSNEIPLGSIQALTYSTTGTGQWIARGYTKPVLPAATVVSLTSTSDRLVSNVALNNVAAFFDGPSASQGSSGTWFATGTVTIEDTGQAAFFVCKLWDGSTVMDSCHATSAAAGATVAVSLSGVITSPAGNIRISVKDLTAATGLILSNISGLSNDSSITAVRIG